LQTVDKEWSCNLGVGWGLTTHHNEKQNVIKHHKPTRNSQQLYTYRFSWWELGIFLFTTTSRTALGPTQPPIQWVLVALSLQVKQRGHEADYSPPSSAEVKECMELYLHSPIHLNGMVLS
jgi:hypothetical protein